MPLDIYDPCPCGSGKKLKFCCQAIADDMDRANRLLEGNQPRAALQNLEALSRKHPNNPWIESTRGLIQLELGEATAARDILRGLLEHHPDHEFGIVLLAAATFQSDGLDAAKKAIHRAFQRSAKKFPSMVSGLAATMAAILSQRGHLLAAREHMGLALRLSPEEQRQEIFVKLLEFDGNESVPYPMRGSHSLPKVEGTEEQQKEIRKAQKYAAVGCWNTAADLFHGLTRSITDSAPLWHSVGLCRAWDGDEIKAAEALHRAAQLYTDFSMAVECEVLAQLLERFDPENAIEACTYTGTVDSVGRLLTLLDECPYAVRRQIPDSLADAPDRPVAIYQLVDRPRYTGSDYAQLTLESLPKSQAHVSVYDSERDSQKPATAELAGDRGADLEEARSRLESISQGAIQWVTEPGKPEVNGYFPKDVQPLRWLWSIPDAAPRSVFRRIRRDGWNQILNNVWPTTPHKSLGGRTPTEAAADPGQKVALTAAVYVVDTYCEQQGHQLDLAEMLGRFQLEQLPVLEVDESTPLSQLSIMHMHRLPVERLTDQQLVSVVNRAMLTHHRRFLSRVLSVALTRPGCESELDLQRVYPAMVEACAQGGRFEEALHWVAVGRTKPLREGSQFESQWNWDMTELDLRIENPDDQALKTLLDRFVNYYVPKVPQMRGLIERMLKVNGVPSPWDSISVITSASGSAASGGALWNPETAGASTQGSSKLWLPGQ